MGTWDRKNFGNDDAMDFVSDFTDRGIDAILDALKPVLSTTVYSYLEAPEAQTALAAIEIVATLKGNAPEDLPEEIEDWIKKNPETKVNESVVLQSQNAIKRILDNNSEINELWEESKEYNEWVEIVKNLENRIL